MLKRSGFHALRWYLTATMVSRIVIIVGGSGIGLATTEAVNAEFLALLTKQRAQVSETSPGINTPTIHVRENRTYSLCPIFAMPQKTE